MTPWLKAWEDQADMNPDAVAVTNRHGQRCTYRHLRDRAHAAEHRLRILGFDSGDRLMATIDYKQPLDEIVVLLWACGLRRGVFYPDWSGFTKRQMKDWRLEEQVSPRVRMHSLTGHEDVFAMPGPGWHDVAVAWPERALDSADRHASPMVVRKVSHAQMAHGIHQWACATQIQPGDVVGWMEGELSALSWLSLFASMSRGAHLVQISGSADEDISKGCQASAVRWLVATPRWLCRAGLPWETCPHGVLAPWGAITPAQRWRWSEKTRWLEVWSPAACGWWWGSIQATATQRDELYLDSCTTRFPWKVDGNGGYLWILNENGWLPTAVVAREDGRIRMSLCATADQSLRMQGDAIVKKIRSLPQVGSVHCGQHDQRDQSHHVVVLPRSDNSNPRRILEDAWKECLDFAPNAAVDYTWITVGSMMPRDERGDLDAKSWVRSVSTD